MAAKNKVELLEITHKGFGKLVKLFETLSEKNSAPQR
ncbi:hypothetical protein CLV80_10385 [Yoonia maritima]|uniref:Uncharacterized protein n=1 Tax=Yoonia maritima TaxID=1435347 RepID=A0A2T0W175_9RHOB|nr:hypothetical protein CLV80_10385 [Yoonia maritima]